MPGGMIRAKVEEPLPAVAYGHKHQYLPVIGAEIWVPTTERRMQT